mmetsp:Transcript_13642/g.33571  ORF Transcript_13642/g.33571 Transcript_13642/m.33571 type:complete len:222 (+) Transcript_13642:2819-3484(+)
MWTWRPPRRDEHVFRRRRRRRRPDDFQPLRARDALCAKSLARCEHRCVHLGSFRCAVCGRFHRERKGICFCIVLVMEPQQARLLQLAPRRARGQWAQPPDRRWQGNQCQRLSTSRSNREGVPRDADSARNARRRVQESGERQGGRRVSDRLLRAHRAGLAALLYPSLHRENSARRVSAPGGSAARRCQAGKGCCTQLCAGGGQRGQHYPGDPTHIPGSREL